MVLVFDFGTTTIKAALFEPGGKLAASGSVPITIAPVSGPGIHEVDPAEWIRAMGTLGAGLLSRANADVSALVVSGNGPTLAVSDSAGRALRPAMTWLDRRGLDEARIVRERCGVFVESSFFLPKILWVKNNEPDVYENAAHFFSCPEFVTHFLTGEAVMVLRTPSDCFSYTTWPVRAS